MHLIGLGRHFNSFQIFLKDPMLRTTWMWSLFIRVTPPLLRHYNTNNVHFSSKVKKMFAFE